MRYLLAITSAALVTPHSFADAEMSRTPLTCESKALPGDRLDISCPLPTKSDPQRYRFTANFTGGHDDTMAQLVAGLDDQHLTCEPGSKVSLMAEDGDVSLFCLFTSPASQSPHEFQLELSWSHAQYLNFTVTPE